MKKGIIWLASYPKSGNTWFRIFLTNLLRDADGPADINDLEKTPIAGARGIFDDEMGIESSDLTADEIDRLRPGLYTYLAETAEEQTFMKIHDAYTHISGKKPLIPPDATDCALYFIRNPLDVAASFADHHGMTHDAAIAAMADSSFTLCGQSDRMSGQLRQKLLSWSEHILSWVDDAPFPVCILRYEDMKLRPLETFLRAARFAHLDYGPEKIQKALAFSSFEKMQDQENLNGFKERSPHARAFFRKGQIGAWQDELTEEQARQIVQDHKKAMLRFGYLNTRGEIIY